LIQAKAKAAVNFINYCNVIAAGHPATAAGARFFTDFTLDFLAFDAPSYIALGLSDYNVWIFL
jgi:hypothetical protein